MPTTSSSALRYPSPTAAPNVPQDVQNLASDLDRKVIPSFANITARNTGIPSPVQGQTCSVGGVLHVYDGAAWRWERRGFQNSTTDANGLIVVGHNLGTTPTGVIVTPGNQSTTLLNNIIDMHVSTTDSSGFVVWVRREDTNAILPSNQVQFSWIAFV